MPSIPQAFIDCMTKFGNNLTYKELIRDLRYVCL